MALRMKRLAATITASIDDVVTKLENHEAVAESMLDDLRQGIAHVRVQRSRIEAQAKRSEEQLRESEENVSRWQSRALEVAEQDEERALQCLQRSENAEKASALQREQLLAHQDMVSELTVRIADMEGKLNELNLRRASLSAREIRSKNSRMKGAGDSMANANKLFERWEESVLTDEYADQSFGVDTENMKDQFERDFIEQEQRESLKTRLESLKRKASPQ